MLALLAMLPLLLSASATPIHKRFTGAQIVSGRDGKCLAAAPKTGSGSPVSTVDCNSNYALLWDINPGSGSVVLTGTQLALDAGSNPGNNGALKVWQSYPGLYQQTWYLTDDNRIAITGGNQCLDEGDNGIQTYQCTPNNDNQVFYVRPGGSGSPSSSVSPSSTASVSASTSSSGPSPTGGVKIHPNGDNTLCVTVSGGYAGVGAKVDIGTCFSDSDQYAKFQLFDLPNGKGPVQLHGENLCLDAGENPSDGTGMKIWTCYDGLFQQDFTFTGGSFQLDNNQCLDVKADSGPDRQKPYTSVKDLQTYTCSAGNTNQQFTV